MGESLKHRLVAAILFVMKDGILKLNPFSLSAVLYKQLLLLHSVIVNRGYEILLLPLSYKVK